ncbi:hypothetical protein HDU81_000799 [Chytriomyces hyalinus]|nr:hypothetical protein HDU81_000799 [Chytriomyces hyalinus]
MSVVGTSITTPSASSASCIIVSYSGCSFNMSANWATTNYGFTFCGNPDAPTNLLYPPNAPTSQVLLPKGLKCDETTRCYKDQQYYCKCFTDPVVQPNCTQAAFSNSLPGSNSNTGSSGSGGGIFDDPLKFGLTISGIILGSLCVIAVIWHCVSGGKTLGPKGISSYIKDRKFQREEIHRKRILEQEEKLDEEARAHANAVRREQELLTVEAERIAQRALETEKLKVAKEIEMDRLTQERHDMMITDMKRKDQLINMLENTTDDYLKRQFEREMLMISMRSEQREEDLKTSGNYVKVLESTIVEDGRIVDSRKEIQRERYARTDKEAQKLMGAVGPDMQRIQNQQQNYGSGANTQNSNRLQGADML